MAAGVTGCSGTETGTGCDVRIAGKCVTLRPGTPADLPPWPSRAAENAIDLDPTARSLSARCRFRGIARRQFDVYRCRVRFYDARIVMQLLHDRRTPTYEFRILRITGERQPVGSLHGLCNPRIAVACRALP